MNILENLVSVEDCNYISGRLHKTWLEAKSKFPGKKLGDKLVEKSFSVYGFYDTEELLWKLTPKVIDITGKKLFPTYSYSRIYFTDAVMPPHTDRESCEYSLSIKLSGDNWPLWFDDGKITKIELEQGHGVLYKGIDTVHWREQFTGSLCIQAFLHWVDSEGPLAEWRYDKRLGLHEPPVLNQTAIPR